MVLPEQVQVQAFLCRFLCRASGLSKILGVSDTACPSYTTRQPQTESWEHPRGCGQCGWGRAGGPAAPSPRCSRPYSLLGSGLGE